MTKAVQKLATVRVGRMVRKQPAAVVQAMRQQGRVKIADYPINNRAARRRAKKGKGVGDD